MTAKPAIAASNGVEASLPFLGTRHIELHRPSVADLEVTTPMSRLVSGTRTPSP